MSAGIETRNLRRLMARTSNPESICPACSIPFACFNPQATCGLSVCPNPRPGLRARVLEALAVPVPESAASDSGIEGTTE